MPADIPQKVTTISWPKVIKAIVIIVVVAVAISGALFWYFYVRQPETSTPATTTKQATTSATPSAKKDGVQNTEFTNPEKTFTLVLPAGWKNTSTRGGVGDSYRAYRFEGPEGWFDVSYGTGYGGGGCPSYSKIKLKSQTIDGCFTINEDGSESFGLAFVEYKGTTFSFTAEITTPKEDNRKVILDILASVELIGTAKLENNLLVE